MPFSAFDKLCMERALALAKKAANCDEVPVGVVIAFDNKIIAEAYNQPIALNDPTAHAEILALREAGKAIGNYRLLNTTIYVTLEPCAMCAAALVHARVNRLVFATCDPKTGACGSVFDLVRNPFLNHQLRVEHGLLQEQSSELLQAFFQRRRADRY